MNRIMSLIGVGLTVLTLMAEAAASEPVNSASKPKLEIDSFDWKGDIPESRAVIVKNHFGSIRSRNQLGEAVFLHATYQLIGDMPLKPEFKISQEGGFLVIEVMYSDDIRDKAGNLRGRTDVAVLFPDSVSIYAETNDGMIKIDKTSSHVEAVTKSGPIKLTTTGLFSAKSDSGKISLRLRGQKSLGTSYAKSDTGTIHATIFKDMSLNLRAMSQGQMIVNGKESKGEQIIALGSKLSEMQFTSKTGKIELEFIDPPALVTSVQPSNVTSVDIDLREAPKAKLWKPGDPIINRDDKTGHLKGKGNNMGRRSLQQ